MDHRIIEGRIFRVVQLEAADVAAHVDHVMNQPPISGQEQRAYLLGLERAAEGIEVAA